jgi:hypothetical protein
MITRTILGPLSLTLLAAGLSACGGPPPPVTPAATPTAVTPVARVEPAAPVDVSAVPEPQGLVAVARVSNPKAVLDAVSGWMHMPSFESAMVSELVFRESVGPVIDISKPIDAAVVLTGSGKKMKPGYAISAAVVSMDDAQKQLGGRFKLNKGPNGIVKIDGMGPPKDDAGGDDSIECVLAPSAGAASARVVCGDATGLSSLTPYLTRTYTREQVPNDFHGEFRVGATKGEMGMVTAELGRLSHRASRGGPESVRRLTEALFGEFGDILADMDKVVIDARIKPQGVGLDFTTVMTGNASLMSQWVASAASRSQPAPAAFMHLPEDTDVAFFGTGIDGNLLDRPASLVSTALTDALKEAKMAEADRKGIVDAVSRTLGLATSPAIFAHGMDLPSLEKASTGNADKDVMIPALAGWWFVGVDKPSNKVVPLMRDWVSLYNRPSLVALRKDKSSSKKDNFKIAITPAPKGSPKDTVHIEFSAIQDSPSTPPSVPGGRTPKAPAAKVITFHALLVADGARTNVLFGFDNDVLVKRAQVSLSSAPDTGTLKGRAGLDALASSKLVGGGFLTLRPFAALSAVDRGDPAGMVKGLSNKGLSPILFTSTATQTGGKGSQTTLTIQMNRDVIDDSARMIMRFMK